MSDSTLPPREDLFRAVMPGLDVRADAADAAAMPTLTGRFAVFNQWTEIRSAWEGEFMERFSPGAFKKTFNESRDKIRVLFQHGKDPVIGDKPLGPIDDLREDAEGAYYEVPLLDTAYNREILPGLEAGLYGASFRFGVMREEWNEKPEPSAHNPRGIAERTVKEASVAEFGPVTFPAYAGASAGVRSITDLVRDVDAMTIATPILLDEERLGRARAFITRSIPPAEQAETEATREDHEAANEAIPVERGEHEDQHQEVAPPTSDAASTPHPERRSHLTTGRRDEAGSHLVKRERERTSKLL